MNKNQFEINQQQEMDKDDIDLKKFWNIAVRNKLFIFTVTILGTSIGIIYSLLRQPVYRGYFQIIVENKNNGISNNFESRSPLESLSNIVSRNNSDNKTQEAILRSPSVLKPVYKYFKENNLTNKKDTKNLSYRSWLSKYLNIRFEEGTNILTINFDNQNKELIISTLNLISSKYQDYSKRDREMTINKGIKYLEIQEKKYKEESTKSLKAFNEFSIENGLGDIDGFVNLEDDISNIIPNNLKQILGINNNNSGISPYKNNATQKSSGAGQRYSAQFALLESYEAQYSDLSAKLKPESKILTSLKTNIDNLKKSLKRPNEILVKFRDLKRLAKRNENLLSNIENNLSILRLEQVKQQSPWELITEPTIDDSRVSPKRKAITISFFITSLIFSYFISFYKEKKEDIIYEIDDFIEKIPFDFKDKFLVGQPKLNELIIKNNYLVNSQNKKIATINLDDSFFKNKSYSVEYLPKIFDFDFINASNIENLKAYESIILFAKKGDITFKKLDIIMRYLNTYDKDKISWIFLEDYS